MAKRQTHQTSSKPAGGTSQAKSAYNYQEFIARHDTKALAAFIIVLVIFIVSIFKNIGYPLFWADESMTAMGTERVLEYGYPKVYDGKNVFYDLRHSDPALGINPKDDAYIGGTGWGHYYYGVVGYKLAELTDDIYLKTAVYRSTYAALGILGLVAFALIISRFFKDRFTRYSLLTLFFLLELLSVSLALLLKEVRYYSLTIFLSSVIIALYCTYRFQRSFNKVAFIVSAIVLLWLLYFTFAPVYFIMIASIGLSELIISGYNYSSLGLKADFHKALPSVIIVAASLLSIFPLLGYFRTFEISRAMNEFNGYNDEMYWSNVTTIINYFKNFELLWLAVILKIFILLSMKTLLKGKHPAFLTANFMLLVLVVSLFSLARIPNFIYTRYIIWLQPILCMMIILDLFVLVGMYSRDSKSLLSSKMLFPLAVSGLAMLLYVGGNAEYIAGRVYELNHPYKGPLDYTIPYIKAKFLKTDSLVIAANYEETSYMYYLGSKVVVGYTGNNLKADSASRPDIIAYRKPWGNYQDIFNGFTQRELYEPVKFPVKDNPVNNIPELNFMPVFNHQFETVQSANDGDAAYLYIRK